MKLVDQVPPSIPIPVPMTAHEWISDVVEAAATLGYRVDAIDWSGSSVTLVPNGTYDTDGITIKSLYLTGAYLLSRIRPIGQR